MRAFVFALALLPVAISAVLPGHPDEYFDILGTGHSDWRLVFRGTAGIRKSMFDAYKDGAGIPYRVDPACKNTVSKCRVSALIEKHAVVRKKGGDVL
ncbi:hypothetical protein ElyMa_006606900 [Elysia marginata]|uniref:Uncharacterized protein n=1 Tax=Elysia marginata TaxID=1093978 RepID=A0AAV4IH16_9GAST|nr:hypothetical protein ElyMa_006606900 [Elysia marginata]